MTPTRAIQSYVDCRKNKEPVSEEILFVLRHYKSFGPNELHWILNVSAYYPEILLEPDMENNIQSLLKGFLAREVNHKF